MHFHLYGVENPGSNSSDDRDWGADVIVRVLEPDGSPGPKDIYVTGGRNHENAHSHGIYLGWSENAYGVRGPIVFPNKQGEMEFEIGASSREECYYSVEVIPREQPYAVLLHIHDGQSEPFAGHLFLTGDNQIQIIKFKINYT